jgi:hypothetical protein
LGPIKRTIAGEQGKAVRHVPAKAAEGDDKAMPALSIQKFDLFSIQYFYLEFKLIV